MYKFLSKTELKAMEMRAATSSPGPWKSFVEGRDHTSGSSFIMTSQGAGRGEDIELTGATVADQDFIAAARQDIPKLITEVRALQEMLAKRNLS